MHSPPWQTEVSLNLRLNAITKTYALILVAWLILMQLTGQWEYLSQYWPMMLTMVAGAFIAGSTSEGGGAVAFPVFTLFFGLSPLIARDFALMIQAVGMGMASFLILRQASPYWRPTLVPVSCGGVIGVVLGIKWLSPLFEPAQIKIFFVTLWLAFASVLIFVNLRKNQEEFIPRCDAKSRLILFFTGLFGGMVSGLTGSGIDMLTFTVLTLYFGIPTRVATPTSVMIMFINAVAGSLFLFSSASYQPQSLEIWWTCIPIVTLFAPLGARFIKNKSSTFLNYMIASLCLFQFFSAIFILKPNYSLMMFSFITMCTGTVSFLLIFKLGNNHSPSIPSIKYHR